MPSRPSFRALPCDRGTLGTTPTRRLSNSRPTNAPPERTPGHGGRERRAACPSGGRAAPRRPGDARAARPGRCAEARAEREASRSRSEPSRSAQGSSTPRPPRPPARSRSPGPCVSAVRARPRAAPTGDGRPFCGHRSAALESCSKPRSMRYARPRVATEEASGVYAWRSFVLRAGHAATTAAAFDGGQFGVSCDVVTSRRQGFERAADGGVDEAGWLHSSPTEAAFRQRFRPAGHGWLDDRVRRGAAPSE